MFLILLSFPAESDNVFSKILKYFLFLLYSRREAGILWIHHRCRPRPRPRPQRFLVSDLQSTFLSGFLSYLAGGLIW